MSKGTKGLILTEKDVAEFGKKIKVFNMLDVNEKQPGLIKARRKLKKGKRMYIISENQCFEEQYLFEQGKKIYVQLNPKSLSELFPAIQYVLDQNNIIIAERLNPRSQLLSTGKGLFSKRKQMNTHHIYTNMMSMNMLDDNEAGFFVKDSKHEANLADPFSEKYTSKKNAER